MMTERKSLHGRMRSLKKRMVVLLFFFILGFISLSGADDVPFFTNEDLESYDSGASRQSSQSPSKEDSARPQSTNEGSLKRPYSHVTVSLYMTTW